MRPPRIAILALFLVACIFLVCRAVTTPSTAKTSSSPSSAKSTFDIGDGGSNIGDESSGFSSFFSFSAPFSLFPPNAIITIADDNSTSFAARPAAFGPPLPGHGLNGQLWIGTGFTEELFQDNEGEGELGCSDVPGWSNGGISSTVLKPSTNSKDQFSKSGKPTDQLSDRRGGYLKSPMGDRSSANPGQTKSLKEAGIVDDGTDDYLHQGISQASSDHADIQSIQEGAEIAGKIVLLSRGGCGFLEKVKWAQRRGAIALIVGDNQRGGPLIQMFARGDTSNVTIPSIFTSRTTAYLLSSLMMQPESNGAHAVDEKASASSKLKSHKRVTSDTDSKPTVREVLRPDMRKVARDDRSAWELIKPGWAARLLGSGPSSPRGDSRSHGSGQLDWVLVQDFADDEKNRKSEASKTHETKPNDRADQPADDGFRIGVEDWRDPDLVRTLHEDDLEEAAKSSSTKMDKTHKTGSESVANLHDKYADAFDSGDKSKANLAASGGLMSKLFGDDDRKVTTGTEPLPVSSENPIIEVPGSGRPGHIPENHDGLWVVITPSSGASPFFDTLLVLVISPLITLTVVYALLMLRARIQRRRWRAPKSVVERLPVRTYHTVTATSSRATTRIPSPTNSTATTPLLQNQRGTAERPRPRSRTTSGLPAAGDILDLNSALNTAPDQAQPRGRPSQWKKYMGRQVECVVCLEEYIDGVSRVMSLPCGHEFHVECITPWLTTRRRTCPICKGDVVRSLARGAAASPYYEAYQGDSSDSSGSSDGSTTFGQVSTSNAGPDPSNIDVERGVTSADDDRQSENWLGSTFNSLRFNFLSRFRQNRQYEEVQGEEEAR